MTGICTTYSGFKLQPERSTNGKKILTVGNWTEHWSVKLKYFKQIWTIFEWESRWSIVHMAFTFWLRWNLNNTWPRFFHFFPVRENLVKRGFCIAPFEFVPFKENVETESLMPDCDIDFFIFNIMSPKFLKFERIQKKNSKTVKVKGQNYKI